MIALLLIVGFYIFGSIAVDIRNALEAIHEDLSRLEQSRRNSSVYESQGKGQQERA